MDKQVLLLKKIWKSALVMLAIVFVVFFGLFWHSVSAQATEGSNINTNTNNNTNDNNINIDIKNEQKNEQTVTVNPLSTQLVVSSSPDAKTATGTAVTSLSTSDSTKGGIASTASAAVGTPDTGPSLWSFLGMFSAVPLGIALSRYGRGRMVSHKEEDLNEVVNGIFKTRICRNTS